MDVLANQHISRTTAILLGDAFTRLRTGPGSITPRALVDDARPKSSPTHALFEWDDAVAGEKHRLAQAGVYIRSVKVELRGNGNGPVEVRAVSNVPGEGYDFTTRILKSKPRRAKLLAQALKELEQFRKRWEHLEELAGVFAEMDKLAG